MDQDRQPGSRANSLAGQGPRQDGYAPRAGMEADLPHVDHPLPPPPPPPPHFRPDPNAHAKVLRSGDLGRGRQRNGFERYDSSEKKYDEIHRMVQPAQAGSHVPFPASVHPAVQALLTRNGERVPYSHQAEVARLVLDEGKNVSLRTPTASGKTVSFLAPTLTLLVEDPKAVALMLYPMNALAADQLKNLIELGFELDPNNRGIGRMNLGGQEIVVGVLNSDCPEESRKIIRQEARMILTNPDSLHISMLAQANRAYKDGTSWARIMRNTRIIVLDEAHLQDGVMGTQTGLAFRRYQAVAQSKGGAPAQVILATATIGNPLEHAETLTGQGNWASVDKSGARTQERTIIVLNPADHPSGDGRWSPNLVIQDLVVDLHLEGKKGLIFCPSRKATGQVADRVNDALGKDVCIAFHSELPKLERQQATEMVLRGKVPWVAATSALEVGVDIGNMDVCICLGHPGDMASLGQRFGRVGRTTPGTVYLVLDENQGPLNTYLQANPSELMGTPESRTVYPGNKILATRHAACAFLETGNLELVRKTFPGVNMREVIDLSRRNPHGTVAMRGGIGDFGQFVAFAPDGATEIAKLSGQDALLNWHTGAVIRTQSGFSSRSYRVVGLSTAAPNLAAYTEPLPEGVSKVYTSPTRNRNVDVVASEPAPGIQSTLVGISDALSGDFDVKEQTVGYKQFTWEVGARKPDKEEVELDPEQMNPAIAFLTRGVQLHMTRENPIADCILGLGAEPEELCGALADAMHKTLPLVVQARPEDVEIEIKVQDIRVQYLQQSSLEPNTSPDSWVTTVTFQFFDVVDGGMGWSEAAGLRLRDWLRASAMLLKNCSCKGEGCPRCTFFPIELLDRRDMVDAVLHATS